MLSLFKNTQAHDWQRWFCVCLQNIYLQGAVWEYFMRIEDFVSFWAIFKCIILYQNLEFCIKNIVLCIKNRAKMSIKSIIFIFSISTTSNPISFTNYSTFISTTNHTTDRHITYYDVWSVEFVTRLYHWWRIDGAIDINVSLF